MAEQDEMTPNTSYLTSIAGEVCNVAVSAALESRQHESEADEAHFVAAAECVESTLHAVLEARRREAVAGEWAAMTTDAKLDHVCRIITTLNVHQQLLRASAPGASSSTSSSSSSPPSSAAVLKTACEIVFPIAVALDAIHHVQCDTVSAADIEKFSRNIGFVVTFRRGLGLAREGPIAEAWAESSSPHRVPLNAPLSTWEGPQEGPLERLCDDTLLSSFRHSGTASAMGERGDRAAADSPLGGIRTSLDVLDELGESYGRVTPTDSGVERGSMFYSPSPLRGSNARHGGGTPHGSTGRSVSRGSVGSSYGMMRHSGGRSASGSPSSGTPQGSSTRGGRQQRGDEAAVTQKVKPWVDNVTAWEVALCLLSVFDPTPTDALSSRHQHMCDPSVFDEFGIALEAALTSVGNRGGVASWNMLNLVDRCGTRRIPAALLTSLVSSSDTTKAAPVKRKLAALMRAAHTPHVAFFDIWRGLVEPDPQGTTPSSSTLKQQKQPQSLLSPAMVTSMIEGYWKQKLLPALPTPISDAFTRKVAIAVRNVAEHLDGITDAGLQCLATAPSSRIHATNMELLVRCLDQVVAWSTKKHLAGETNGTTTTTGSSNIVGLSPTAPPSRTSVSTSDVAPQPQFGVLTTEFILLLRDPSRRTAFKKLLGTRRTEWAVVDVELFNVMHQTLEQPLVHSMHVVGSGGGGGGSTRAGGAFARRAHQPAAEAANVQQKQLFDTQEVLFRLRQFLVAMSDLAALYFGWSVTSVPLSGSSSSAAGGGVATSSGVCAPTLGTVMVDFTSRSRLHSSGGGGGEASSKEEVHHRERMKQLLLRTRNNEGGGAGGRSADDAAVTTAAASRRSPNLTTASTAAHDDGDDSTIWSYIRDADSPELLLQEERVLASQLRPRTAPPRNKPLRNSVGGGGGDTNSKLVPVPPPAAGGSSRGTGGRPSRF